MTAQSNFLPPRHHSAQSVDCHPPSTPGHLATVNRSNTPDYIARIKKVDLVYQYYVCMSAAFYLPRSLADNNKRYSESELLTASRCVIILAEPGAGKTALMGSLARQLGAKVVTASTFAYKRVTKSNTPLLIDAFDELSKVDDSGIHKLLGKAEAANPTHVYLSSRSSEWDSAATKAVEDFFGPSSLVVRLCEFDADEQQKIFHRDYPEEDFSTFHAEVARFDLEALLPNPQFLKLFAEAYIESDRHFTDKRSIFTKAVERLAKEANPHVKPLISALSIDQKISRASEVFVKLLLSGAEGIGTSESTENHYPCLVSLLEGDSAAHNILATRLFKPGDRPDQHRPVHRIIAEYCAADYLTKQIIDPTNPLTLSKCLAIIAPNSTVRDELRGLLGWMAALGNKSIQEATIELDPYAVLANGDPSQLEPSSKCLLIEQLKKAEAQDPYFRRGDFGRRFSMAGFFTPDVVAAIKPLLTSGNDGQLRTLLLELLRGSPAIKQLRGELSQIVLTLAEDDGARRFANECLLEINTDIDVYLSMLGHLISEGSDLSLSVAAKTITTLGSENFERAYLAEFLRICSKLYLGRYASFMGIRYHLEQFIEGLELETIEWLLDELTKDLKCICGKKSYECYCRDSISKIIGLMLDRHFELSTPPFDPARIWQWVRNLHFQGQDSAEQSKAVRVLQNDHALRQGIIKHVFGELTDRNEIMKIWHDFFYEHSKYHAGLPFQKDDYRFMVELAFTTDNPDLWVSFMAYHQRYGDEKQGDLNGLRCRMREQALEKPLFMREWAKINRTVKHYRRKNRMRDFRRTRQMKRRQRQEDEVRATNIQYVRDNRELVESGRHWSCLVRFAQLVLMSPDRIEYEFGDEVLVRNALKSCLEFITPYVYNLRELAESECKSESRYSGIILYAACLEIMRTQGNLKGVSLHLLRALRTNIRMGYDVVSDEERDALHKEVDRLLFSDHDDAENFLREYVEPQLAQPGCAHPEVGLLCSDDAFQHLCAPLSIEWLQNFPDIALGALDTLFEIAAQVGDRDKLKAIIAERCAELMSSYPELTSSEDIEQKRTFWLIRAWYFLDDPPRAYWDWLKADRNTVLLLNDPSGRFLHDQYYWPKLTSTKVEAVLDTFIDRWPKVALPGTHGTSSPPGEKAYRFLTNVIWSINADEPDKAIPVLNRLLGDLRFTDLHNNLKSIHATQVRQKALKDFKPPTPQDIVKFLNKDEVVTVEGLRKLVLHELHAYQKEIDGGEFNTIDRFYEKDRQRNKDKRLDEERSRDIIAEYLKLRLEPQGIIITPEHQLKSAKRSDFTAAKIINGKRRLLVTEVKGQWHKELYTAAAEQLHERYSIHSDAEQQGVFLAIWFGADEKVAGRKNRDIQTAQGLKSKIEAKLPQELKGLIDVFVLDVSRSPN